MYKAPKFNDFKKSFPKKVRTCVKKSAIVKKT